MNYDRPELIERLAAEYVLGTLQGKSRLRFERLMMESYRARNTVWEWEQHINPLIMAIPGRSPSAKVWKQIQLRITPARQSPGHWFWPDWGSLASMAAVVLAIVLLVTAQPMTQAPAEFVATFSDESAQPLWLVTTHPVSKKLVIKPVNSQATQMDNKAYELWMLPVQGKPVSLGLMPVSPRVTERVLTPQILKIIENSQGMAISLEPAGGSPTGLPTGPILYKAPLFSL